MSKSDEVIDAEYDEEVIRYGEEILKIISASFFVSLILAIISSMFLEMLFFMATVLPLRHYAGGFHINSKTGCGICSVFILAGSLLMFRIIQLPQIIIFLIYFVVLYFILKLGPIDNECNKLNIKEKNILSTFLNRIALLQASVFVLLFIGNVGYYTFIMCWCTAIVLFLQVLGCIKNCVAGGAESYDSNWNL